MSARFRRRAGALALVALLSAALWGFSGRLAGGGDSTDWAEVHREDLVLGVEATGTLSAVDSAPLGPPQIPEMWNQKIAFLAPEGMEVAAGTPVVRFDTTDLETKLAEKLAEQASAGQEYEKKAASLAMERRDEEMALAEAEAKRKKSALKVDVPADLVAASELKQSRADLALAEREIAYRKARLTVGRREGEAELAALAKRRDLAAARVAEIQRQIERMTVRAPRAGTLVYSSDRRGEKKKIGDTIWQGETVVEIPNLARMRAEAQVDEADAGRVAPGQPVVLRLDAHPDLAYAGRVSSVRRAVQERSEQRRDKVVEVRIDLARTDPQRMRPGMRLRAFLETGRVRGALVVPVEAVQATAAGPLVRRRTLFGSEPVRPRLGRRNGRLVEVLGGLAPGDRVARVAPGGSGEAGGG
jgi:multidrug resistance efflux pump